MQSTEIRLMEELVKLANGDKEWQNYLMAAFIEQKTTQIKRMQTALWVEDWKEIKDIAHCMKSTFIFLPFPESLELVDKLFHTAGNNAAKTKTEVDALITICINAMQVYNVLLEERN